MPQVPSIYKHVCLLGTKVVCIFLALVLLLTYKVNGALILIKVLPQKSFERLTYSHSKQSNDDVQKCLIIGLMRTWQM